MLIAVLVIAAAVLFLWLRSSDVFAVRRITATAPQSVTQEELSQATLGALGVSLLRLSTDEIEAHLCDLPYVRSAEVHRGFPDTLEVRLSEYEPVARLRSAEGEDVWLVADDGRILEKARAPRGVNLPLIVSTAEIAPELGTRVTGAVVKALLLVYLVGDEESSGNLPPVRQIVVSAAGALALELEGGTEIRVGEPSKLEQKLMVAADIVEQYSRDGVRVEYVDVTSPERAAVKAK